MSNELSQDLPLPEHLLLKIKVMHSVLDINNFKMTPTINVSNHL